MKKLMLISVLIATLGFAQAQENKFSLNGGYVFTNIEDADDNAGGWRLNALYEFNPGAGIFSHGFATGFMTSSAEQTSGVKQGEYKINTWPIYYAPKVTLGKGKLKGVVKGALGTHVSTLKHTGTLAEVKTTDMGFYGGASAGFTVDFTDKVFLNADYEWAYLSNSSYRDGFVNSIMAGIGINF